MGYSEDHSVASIWDQASWLLLRSTEADIWKNPVSHFSPLPVPTQNIAFFVLFYSVNSVHIVMQSGAKTSHQNQNFFGPERHNKAYILYFAAWSYQNWVSGIVFSTKLALSR